MLFDIDTVSTVIWAAALGIIIAVIYVNVQRRALSKFICGLIDASSFDENSSKSFSDLSIVGLDALILKSALKNQHGLKRVVRSKAINDNSADEAEVLLSGSKKMYCYWLSSNDDVDSIKSKYYFEAFSSLRIVVTIICIIVAVITTCGLFEFFDGYFDSKDSKDTVEESENDNTQSTDIADEFDSDKSTAPTVPTVPVVPSQAEEHDASQNPTIPFSYGE